MKLKKLWLFAIFAAICVCSLSLCASASFRGDSGALVLDSEYFKDRGFDNASAMLESAADKASDSFILVFYSRYDSHCKQLIPQIKQWADSEKVPVYGIDQYNKYILEYGYFNNKTALEGWERWLDKEAFAFPAVFAYNGDTRIMTAADKVYTLDSFKQIVGKSGLLGNVYHDYAAAESASKTLNKLGLLLGTGEGFDLDRSPSRAEALVMLLRLLGKEQEALILNLPHPFTDVPEWVSPYVGYAYYYGITNGTDYNTFHPDMSVSSAHFLTFVLRALGYSSESGGDFEWLSPYSLATTVGALPDGVNIAEFLRGEMAIVCNSALNCGVKGSSYTLAQKLVYQRAVPADSLYTATGIYLSTPSAIEERKQLQKTWLNTVTLTAHSPAYILDAAEAAAYMVPRNIIFSVPAGAESNWIKYLQENLSLPSEIASSVSFAAEEGIVYIHPKYTIAVGALAYLTVPGYYASGNDKLAAGEIMKHMADIKLAGADAWADTFFHDAEMLPETEVRYSDVDAALYLGKCTPSATQKTKWLANKVSEAQEKGEILDVDLS